MKCQHTALPYDKPPLTSFFLITVLVTSIYSSKESNWEDGWIKTSRANGHGGPFPTNHVSIGEVSGTGLFTTNYIVNFTTMMK